MTDEVDRARRSDLAAARAPCGAGSPAPAGQVTIVGVTKPHPVGVLRRRDGGRVRGFRRELRRRSWSGRSPERSDRSTAPRLRISSDSSRPTRSAWWPRTCRCTRRVDRPSLVDANCARRAAGARVLMQVEPRRSIPGRGGAAAVRRCPGADRAAPDAGLHGGRRGHGGRHRRGADTRPGVASASSSAASHLRRRVAPADCLDGHVRRLRGGGGRGGRRWSGSVGSVRPRECELHADRGHADLSVGRPMRDTGRVWRRRDGWDAAQGNVVVGPRPGRGLRRL